MNNIYQKLWDTSPYQWCKVLSAKILKNKNIFYSIDDILKSTKLMRHSRMLDILLRYEHILKSRKESFSVFNFENKNILEIGCGPVIGFAPIAIFLGCKSYTGIEPMFNNGILSNVVFQKTYLFKLYRDLLVPLFGSLMTFQEFLNKLISNVTIYNCNYLDLEFRLKYDYILSNSVLEHIFPLDDTVRRLAEESTKDTQFIHDVDFGNHLNKSWFFETIYDHEMNDAKKFHSPHINLYRSGDILDLFESNGLNCKCIPIVTESTEEKNSIHESWLKKYNKQSLITKTALFISSK